MKTLDIVPCEDPSYDWGVGSGSGRLVCTVIFAWVSATTYDMHRRGANCLLRCAGKHIFLYQVSFFSPSLLLRYNSEPLAGVA